MVLIHGGRFEMGAGGVYPEEGPPVEISVGDFWISRHDVTNAQFARFVRETGYRTVGERGGQTVSGKVEPAGGAVFEMPSAVDDGRPVRWWHFVAGADWRHPQGPGSDLRGKADHPVVQIAYADAQAYATWAGLQLPSEAQWEYAARGGGASGTATAQAAVAHGVPRANVWQGVFPFFNSDADGFIGTSPVGCFPANGYGLYDMVGNVWQWTTDLYFPSHRYPVGLRSFDPNNPNVPSRVIKGGSFLCAANFCMRYRPAARQPHDEGLGTSHIGFRLVRLATPNGAPRAG
ncbi:formylglycine-generating enzyme family protein [Solimonas sp. C16B3]|uniref:Formylglycine-generating enzyme family protein n=2 Tax=Solimonas marina TaxID=2714601 RepID=A0A970B9N5_9GAMM|nr:formylglycine-generating enzyme family protein [Solimonas marina]NKF23529.1 formylglycine-generating enzyme family protein [Solimonas marina]